MTEWLVTYFLHSTLVLCSVLLLVRCCTPSAAFRDGLLRIALCLPVFTALLSVSSLSPLRAVSPLASSPTSIKPLDTVVGVSAPQSTDGHFASPVLARPTVIPLSLPDRMSSWALFLLLGSAGWAVVRYGLAWRRLPLRDGQPIEAPTLLSALRQIATRSTLRGVRLLQAPVPGPCALGRRTILLPPGLEQRLTAPQLEAVLAHEYAHLIRRDPLWTVGLGLFVQVLWFQPLNWVVLTAWRQASEEQCDGWAAHSTSPLHLAQALLNLARTASLHPQSLLSPAASATHLTVRITALIRPKEPSMTRLPFVLLAGLPFAVVAVLPPLALAGSGAPQAVVVLDPGHGGDEPGVVAYAIEKEVALSLARQIRSELTRAGVRVIMTRERDQQLTVQERIKLANSLAVRPAKLFLSLHLNADEDGTQSGINAYVAPAQAVPAHQEASKVFATRLLDEVSRGTGAKSNGIRAIDYTVLTRAKVPAALLSVGFATNQTEGQMLVSPDYQKRLSASVARAILLTLQSP